MRIQQILVFFSLINKKDCKNYKNCTNRSRTDLIRNFQRRTGLVRIIQDRSPNTKNQDSGSGPPVRSGPVHNPVHDINLKQKNLYLKSGVFVSNDTLTAPSMVS